MPPSSRAGRQIENPTNTPRGDKKTSAEQEELKSLVAEAFEEANAAEQRKREELRQARGY
ncbi:MAG: hypothetical protein MK135_02215 [Polyangiaceae bacterium]|nr:hypothetical protein [Polyangiaceae bacterium]